MPPVAPLAPADGAADPPLFEQAATMKLAAAASARNLRVRMLVLSSSYDSWPRTLACHGITTRSIAMIAR